MRRVELAGAAIALAACAATPAADGGGGSSVASGGASSGGASSGGGSCAPVTMPGPDGGVYIAVATDAGFSSYSPQDFTVCLPPGPFAQAIWIYRAQGGSGQDCATYPSGWYSGVCSPSGDHVDRIIANGLIFPPELGDAGLADGGYFLEFDRAITNYGGLTSYTRDVGDLAPLLTGGETTFRLLLQNGCSKGGYSVDASLYLLPGAPPAQAFGHAAPGLAFARVADVPDGGGGQASAPLDLAEPLSNAQLLVFATGHNSQGLSCEEFCPGDQVAFALDGADAGVLTPEMGLDDPSCVAGCDGCGGDCSSSSCTGRSSCSAASGCCEASGIEREGWCPGKPSPPYLLPLGDLAAGPHLLTVTSPGAVTPGGYWVVSANLVGE